MRTPAILLALAPVFVAPAAAQDAGRELADQYRQASELQRLAYIERVFLETRFKNETPRRLNALVAAGKACVDDWDAKLEPNFLEHLASCMVMANRTVKAEP